MSILEDEDPVSGHREEPELATPEFGTNFEAHAIKERGQFNVAVPHAIKERGQ